MKIALNEIKKYVKIPEGMETDELVKLIGSRLVEVEGTEDWGEKYAGIYIVKVVKCEKISETHLSLCQIDAGKAGKKWAGSGNVLVDGEVDAEAEKGGLVQVVCGAPNARAGMMAVWITPGAVVPETWGGENFELSVRKLRGYKSHGMLAALDELDLGEDHEGILEIRSGSAEAGESFAKKFGLDDVILDIENKSLTHRPDCFGIIGFAREVAGILGQKFEAEVNPTNHPEGRPQRGSARLALEPLWRQGFQTRSEGDSLDLPLPQVSNSEICGRYTCAVVEMEGATEKSKYLSETDVFLAKAGMRGISKIVDVTNVLMLLTGQPLHAFDYDKFVTVGGDSAAQIGIRTARDGEELELIDGKVVKCDTNDILITSNDIPVALAGAMGGKSTEIDDGTRRVLIESASFSLYHLRKTQMKHGIFSEAITRFTKGVPVGMAEVVLKMAVDELGGKVVAMADTMEKTPKEIVVKLTTDEVNNLLGTEYSGELMKKTLENVGFVVKLVAGKMAVTVPYWRTDIHIPEDVIEEVGRLLGFDNIPQDLPLRPFVGAREDEILGLKAQMRSVLSDKLGVHELLTYSFVNKKLQEKVGEKVTDSYEIVNSISPDLQVFRQSIVPSLLEKTYENVKAGHRDFVLYELNQVTSKSLGLEDGVPVMKNHLAVVGLGDFYRVKDVLVKLLGELGIEADLKAAKDVVSYFEPVRAAEVVVLGKEGEEVTIGGIGEIRVGVRKAMKLPEASGFEIDLDELLRAQRSVKRGKRLSKFPTVERDVTVVVEKTEKYATLYRKIMGVLERQHELVYAVEPLSIYQAKKEDATKNVSFRLKFSNLEKTLTSEEISAMMKQVTKTLEKTGAKVI